jgi:hypothetical protein
MLLLLVNLVLNLYGTSGRNSGPSLLMDPLFWQILFCVFFCFLIMILNLAFLFLVNVQMKKQRGTLSLLILSKYRYINQLETYALIHSRSSASPSSLSASSLSSLSVPLHEIPALIAEQHHLISGLDDILTVYENIDEIKGSKLAGFKIERQHLVWILTTLTLFLYSLYQYFIDHH